MTRVWMRKTDAELFIYEQIAIYGAATLLARPYALSQNIELYAGLYDCRFNPKDFIDLGPL